MKRIIVCICLLLSFISYSYAQAALENLIIGKWKYQNLTEVVYEDVGPKVATNLNSLGKNLENSDSYYVFKPDKTGERINNTNKKETKTPILWSIEYYEQKTYKKDKEYYLKIITNNYNITSVQRFFFSWIYNTEYYAVFSNNINTNITGFSLWEKIEYF